MKVSVLTQQAHGLWYQRNLFLLAAASLLISNVVLSFFVFSRSERVLLLPPEVTRPLWAEKNLLSQAYLEEMALFMAHLVLDNSPERAAYQRQALLKYVAPDSYGPLRAQLLAQEASFKKNAVATSFRPQETTVFSKKNRVVIKGKLLSFVGQKKVSEAEEVFDIRFTLQHGRLFIQSFSPFEQEASDNVPSF